MNSILGILNKIYGVFDNLSLSVIFALVIYIAAACVILLIDDKQRRKSIYYNPNDWFSMISIINSLICSLQREQTRRK